MRPNKRLKLAAPVGLWNDSFFSAPKLKRDPLDGGKEASMRTRFIVLATLIPLAAACATSGASAQVPVSHIPAVQDSAIGESLRNAREALANAQRLFDDTTVFAAAYRARDNAAALSVRLEAQQAALEQKLQQTDEHLRTVFQQLERTQRRLDEMMRQQRH